ncbi:MAG: hypothetical protein HYX78_14375 [Armatimonadetes bacterium]|nr:hypothetical protein [Armatimonadota bacterium]
MKLMFCKPDEEVARELGVKLETVALWRENTEFQEALAEEEKAIKSAAARISSDASLAAAKNLHRLMTEGKDGKLCLDTLKASGAFEKKENDPADALESLVQRAAEGNGTDT